MTDVIPILEDTRIWVYLRDLILYDLEDRGPPDELSLKLMDFMRRHWPTHAPRQYEVAALEQRIKVAEREVEQRGTEIKRLNTLIKEWQKTQ